MAATKNPLNKDAKYEARLRTWQGSMERQNEGYKGIEDVVQISIYKFALLRNEERILTDKLGARAQSVKAELIKIENISDMNKAVLIGAQQRGRPHWMKVG